MESVTNSFRSVPDLGSAESQFGAAKSVIPVKVLSAQGFDAIAS